MKDVENTLSNTSGGKSKKEKASSKVAKSAGIGGAIGGAIGGLVGSLLSQLKPVKEFLGIISGIMEILLVPILNILKPFLVLFLKIGIGLYKWLQDSGFIDAANKIAEGIDKGGLQGGVKATEDIASGLVEEKGKSWAAIVAGILLVVGEVLLFAVGGWILVLLGTIAALIIVFWDEIKMAWDWLVASVISIGEWIWDAILVGWGFLKSVGAWIWNFILGSLQFIADLGVKIWNFFLAGLKFISDLGVKLWDWFKNALSSIGDLGSKIWSYIKSAMSSLIRGGKGGKSTSANDALITSEGNIVKFNPNDNILAFQDFSTLGNFGGGSGSSQNITINVQGYVGDEQELADKIGKALKNSSRGGISNF